MYICKSSLITNVTLSLSLSLSSTECDYLAARADHPLGMFTSGCGHNMHADCWKR